MPWTLNDILLGLKSAGDSGLTLSTIEKKLGAKFREALPSHLKELKERDQIWGPLSKGAAKYYFAAGQGPSIEATSREISNIVKRAATKLLSDSALAKSVTGFHKKFFADALRNAVSTKSLMRVNCGQGKYYLHRDIAAEFFAWQEAGEADPASRLPTDHGELTFERARPVYERLKQEQGGFGTVKIYDLQRALKLPLATVHRFLLSESKSGRLTIHPATTVNYPAEVIAAGIRLSGYPDPFVTVAFKDQV